MYFLSALSAFEFHHIQEKADVWIIDGQIGGALQVRGKIGVFILGWIAPLILKMHMQIAEENQISSHSRKPIF